MDEVLRIELSGSSLYADTSNQVMGKGMLNNFDLIAFVPAVDTERARMFYVDVLGLEFVQDDGFALVVKANGKMVRIVTMRDFSPASYTILGWGVQDINTTAAGLAARGVIFERYPGIEQDETGVWIAPGGSKVAWFKDPDGNVLSISQH